MLKYFVNIFFESILLVHSTPLYEKREGSGSGSVPLTNVPGSGRAENMRILRIRIPYTSLNINIVGLKDDICSRLFLRLTWGDSGRRGRNGSTVLRMFCFSCSSLPPASMIRYFKGILQQAEFFKIFNFLTLFSARVLMVPKDIFAHLLRKKNNYTLKTIQ